LKVLFIYSDGAGDANCSLHNAIFPAEAINKKKGHTADCIHISEFLTNSPIAQELCANADIIVVERNLFDDTLSYMQFWKVRNKNVAVIFDDAYHLIEPENASHYFWAKGLEEKGKTPGAIPLLLKLSKCDILPDQPIKISFLSCGNRGSLFSYRSNFK